MNVIKACYQELIPQCGSELCALSEVVGSLGPWLPAFKFCQRVEVQSSPVFVGIARLRDRTSVRIPRGSTKVVAATSLASLASFQSVLVKPLSQEYCLPAGLLVFTAMVGYPGVLLRS